MNYSNENMLKFFTKKNLKVQLFNKISSFSEEIFDIIEEKIK